MAFECPKVYTAFSIIIYDLQRLVRQKFVNWSHTELDKHFINHYPAHCSHCDFELFACYGLLFLKLFLQFVYTFLGHTNY